MSDQARKWAFGWVQAGRLSDSEGRVLLALADAHQPGDSPAVRVLVSDVERTSGLGCGAVLLALHKLYFCDLIGLPNGISADLVAVLKFNTLAGSFASAHEDGEEAL